MRLLGSNAHKNEASRRVDNMYLNLVCAFGHKKVDHLLQIGLAGPMQVQAKLFSLSPLFLLAARMSWFSVPFCGYSCECWPESC